MKYSRLSAFASVAALCALTVPMAVAAGCGSTTPAPPLGAQGEIDASLPNKANDKVGDGGTTSTPDAAKKEEPGTVPDGSVTGIDPTAPLAELAKGYAAAVCARASECCTEEERQGMLSTFSAPKFNNGKFDAPIPPASTCEAVISQRIQGLLDRYAGSIKRGRMAFDEAQAKACVTKLKTTACGPELFAAGTSEACLDTRRGVVFRKIAPLGSPCQGLDDGNLLGECQPDLGYCQNKIGKADAGGLCVAWRKEGEACSLDRDAGVINFCDTRKGAYCVGTTCSPNGRQLEPGDLCGGSSGAANWCPPGQYCTDLGDEGVCAPKKADGEECTEQEQCRTELPGTCQVLPDGGTRRCGYRGLCSGVTR